MPNLSSINISTSPSLEKLYASLSLEELYTTPVDESLMDTPDSVVTPNPPPAPGEDSLEAIFNSTNFISRSDNCNLADELLRTNLSNVNVEQPFLADSTPALGLAVSNRLDDCYTTFD